MDNEKFVNRCIEMLVDYHNQQYEVIKISEHDVYVVWLTKVLKNNKALLSTTLPDGAYYEITYNGEKEEFYFDAYKKEENICIKKISEVI